MPLTAPPTTHDPRPTAPRGYTLLEMLTTVAALVIVLGLMVSLARYVRRQSADRLTKDLLAQLDVLLERYELRYRALPPAPNLVPDAESIVGKESADGLHAMPQAASEELPSAATQTATTNTASPLATPLLPVDENLPEEQVLQQGAWANNRALISALRIEARRQADQFVDLPTSFWDDSLLLDAWGVPIAYMPTMHPAIGMAMENRPFFLSAGPDRKFRTLEDNLYSYDNQ